MTELILDKLKNLNAGIELMEDDNLKIHADIARLPAELLREIRLRKKDIVRYLKARGLSGSFTEIPIADSSESYPLSSAQKRLWILSRFEGGNLAYNMPGIYKLEGALNPAALENAFSSLIQRHEILRTVFRENGSGEVRQFILSPEEVLFNIEYEDLRHSEKQQETLTMLLEEEYKRAFDLEQGPLLRAGLYCIDDNRWVFAYTMHHIISDGWSMDILMSELMLFYNAFHKGERKELDPLRIQYKDFAVWQQRQLHGGVLEAHKAYWMNNCADQPPVIDIPGDRSRPAIKTYRGSTHAVTFSHSLSRDIKELCQEQGGTLFMGLVALINTLLYKYTGQKDIMIGTPVAGRDHADLGNQLGLYVNTIVLRTTFSENDNFPGLLANVKKMVLGAFKYQDYPFDKLVDDLSIRRDMSRNALFDVMLSLQSNHISPPAGAGGPRMEDVKLGTFRGEGNTISKFDVLFNFAERGDRILAEIEYNSDIYNKDTIRRLLDHMVNLAADAVKDPAKPIWQLNCIGDKEREMLLSIFNDTRMDYPADLTMTDMFERQVSRTPQATALIFGNTKLTYEELDEVSSRFAAFLHTHYGIRPGDFVGIKLQRGEWQIIAVLGILKCRGAYVPVDPDYPQERIDYMMSDCKCKIVIGEAETRYFIDEWKDNAAAIPVTSGKPEDLAYVIYTSGSTGIPKGVMIAHSSVVNLIISQMKEFGITGEDNILQFSALSFDASVEQIFIALCSGARLTLIDRPTLLDPGKLEAFIDVNQITHVHTVPAILKLLKARKYNSLRRVIAGGDQCPGDLAEQWSRYHLFYNEYGPTETTVTSIEYACRNASDHTVLPIGRPVSNTEVYILDEQGGVQPVGVVGEIYIGGRGLAKGYLNQPGQTAEKFIPNPFRPGERMYRTGDWGRWLPDGNIGFLGRKDGQVKLYGYRIETGEIENALTRHPLIDAAVVIIRQGRNDTQSLIAYVTSPEPLDIASIRKHLSRTMPAYMIPGDFIRLDKMPLNSNGKIDRTDLPEPDSTAPLQSPEYPVTMLEEDLITVYEEVLNRKPLGLKDNFFEWGGDSIKSIQIASRLKQKGYAVSIQDIIMYPVIGDMASKVKETSSVIDQEIVEGNIPLSPIQAFFFSNSSESRHHFNQSVLLKSDRSLSEEGISMVLDRLAAHHDALRMTYSRSSDGWDQRNNGLDQRYAMEVIENAEEPDFIRHCERFQAEFSLETGPLFRVCIFRGAAHDRILLVVHHLVIDGVSWRILLEDLDNLYRQFLSGQPLNLPKKTNSYRDWVNQQLRYSASGELKKEIPFWSAITSEPYDKLPLDHPAENLVKDTYTCSFSLDGELTEQLVTQAYAAYSTGINELLLTAFSMALRETFGMSKVLVNMEGHGREYIGSDVDVTRTIGWFTSMYLVLVDVSGEDIISQLMEVKRRLGLVPNKGIGYGILRHFTGMDYGIMPEINFNYLGDFGSGASVEEGQQLFEFLGDYHGKAIADDMPRHFLLDVSGMIVEGRLRLSIGYGRHQYSTGTMERLISSCRQQLERLIPTHPETLAGASYNQLFYFSPWQTRGDVVTLAWEFEELDPDRFRRSAARMIERHEILRTVFTTADGDIKQKILPPDQFELDVWQTDIPLSDLEFDAVLMKESVRKFDLHNFPLMIVRIFRTPDGRHKVLFAMHHSIIDGHSLSILQNEFLTIYTAAGEKDALPALRFQYKDFANWQRKFVDSAEGRRHRGYWLEKLKGFSPDAGVKDFHIPDEDGLCVYMKQIVNGQLYRDLDGLVRGNGLTFPSFVMSILTLFLWKTGAQDDITIITPVSVRDSELYGAYSWNDLIGYFTNLILVRNIIDKELTIVQYLQQVRDNFLNDLKFGAYPFRRLVDELPGSALTNEFLDPIVYFNYNNYDHGRNVPPEPVDEGWEGVGEPVVPMQCMLGCIVVEFNGGLELQLTFRKSIFSTPERKRMADLFFSILKETVSEPYKLLKDIGAFIPQH
jgi:amino acid adenylation domain-containing protein/non-ribosomal peptide synthase protein (TIGR01720 family)